MHSLLRGRPRRRRRKALGARHRAGPNPRRSDARRDLRKGGRKKNFRKSLAVSKIRRNFAPATAKTAVAPTEENIERIAIETRVVQEQS